MLEGIRLDSRVYPLTQQPGPPDGLPPSVLENAAMRGLLYEVGTLTSKQRKIQCQLWGIES